jgi:hypothetical protein
MRAYACGLFLALTIFAGTAEAKDLFKHGPVTCRSTAAGVSDLVVDTCSWKKKQGGGFYTGKCNGSVSIDGEQIVFDVSGEAKRIDYVFPDNDAPLDFEYRGVSCGVESPRLKTVRNCRPLKKGIGKECQVCAVTAAKVCFNVRLDIAVKSKTASVPEGVLTEDMVGSIAPVQ